ncbi:cytochrome P450 [Billgrantia endophytica]|uniref:Cytochrome P450 n=1 Tax=Billgrantia endophytica TaxID=2033802 RepID=A0A2N7TZI6_9GAMM|nr:cytochrome P450 [Halomonas endophytica]PMR73599.1 cytochrome P450 [Halomonas endophytica]
MARESVQGSLPTATLGETLAVINDVFVPNIAKGVIIRRPRVVGMAERMALDERAVRRVQKLNKKYGKGPLLLKVPGKSMALILDPDDANRVLDESPEPFATAEQAKRSALAHFEPDMALVSHGRKRAERRRFNEEVLQSECPVHGLSERFVPVVEQEAEALLARVRSNQGELGWDMFIDTWDRIVRRVVLGDSASDDQELTETLAKLRAAGNWGFLHPQRTRLRKRFLETLQGYIDRAEPGSLAAEAARVPTNSDTKPSNQMPQWLFAFEPAGMATFSALALLSAHADQAERARAEIARHEGDQRPDMSFLRACLLESLRLWPTTPLVLRQSTERTHWQNGEMPADTSILILAPYFHRDDRHLDDANRFDPDLWLKPEGAGEWPLIPFSGGPGICPGRHLVLLVTSAMLASLMKRHEFRLDPPDRLLASQPMPALLSNYHLRFKVSRN